MTIIWPADAPQEMNLNGLEYTLPDNTLRTKAEFGPTRDRRRTTSGWGAIKGTITATMDQWQSIETFYSVTTADGSLPFEWIRPFSSDVATFKFTKPPRVTSRSGALLSVTLEMAVRK